MTQALHRRLAPLVSARLLRLHELLSARLEHGLHAKGLTPAEFRLVGVLLAEPHGLRQRELAERLGVRPPTVSAALPRLEKARVIERVEDPRDPRAWLVRVRKTTALVPGVQVLEALDATLLASLSKRDRAQFVTLLDRVTTALEAA